MADSSEPSSMEFCAFVRELNQANHFDPTNSSWNCCPAESRLSQEFENNMQLLLSNCDLDRENELIANIPVLKTEHCALEPDLKDLGNNNACSNNTLCHDNSLETTIDNEDDPLELTGECDDSGDPGDGGSSDEQQQSKSLSLSYSLSISHAHDNFSQYSQSTDKGLSKRYDSPCSYEDDRESECTNFDKLDDWNDFINDMQNNNTADNGNKDFKEYYDEYLASNNLKDNDDEDDPTEDFNTKEDTDITGKMLEDIAKDNSLDSVDESWDQQSDTPAFPRRVSTVEKCRSFNQYRNPNDVEDLSMNLEDTHISTGDPIQRIPSCKRKFQYDDIDDYKYEVTQVVTEKLLNLDDCHVPISQIDNELFAKLVRIESYEPTSASIITSDNYNKNKPICSKSYGDENDETEWTNATTPTNSGSLEQMIQVFENSADIKKQIEYQRNLDKST